MYIDDFICLPKIVDKLAVKHHVEIEEVEEIFFNRLQYRLLNLAIGKIKMYILP